ncbi:MAG TPA: histidine phosphatase family protein [Steroidobacteraceae bacterium]|nr:histidine phosphatase family protein [Steroidobacteraceae bacterium]
MELLIVRHAIACDRDPRRWPDDAERPLSPPGVTRARRAAAGLKRLAPRPARVLTSPLVRTRETAAILTQFAAWPKATSCPLLLPGASPEALLGLLARSGNRCIAVVGHEPDLSRLLATCLSGDAAHTAFEFRKMGVALIAFPGKPSAGEAELLWFVPPRLLRAARRTPQ